MMFSENIEHQEEIKHYFQFIFRPHSTLPIFISFKKMYKTELFFKIVDFQNSAFQVEAPCPICPILAYWYDKIS